MRDQPRLNEEEWALVIDLLESERNELPVEIHHTRNAQVREELHHRSKMVRELLDRLNVSVSA
jgi:hypothetical protein